MQNDYLLECCSEKDGLLSIQRFSNGEMEAEIVNALGTKRLLIEMPFIAAKRERLNKSISLLEDSRAVLAKIMDKIVMILSFSFHFFVDKILSFSF